MSSTQTMLAPFTRPDLEKRIARYMKEHPGSALAGRSGPSVHRTNPRGAHSRRRAPERRGWNAVRKAGLDPRSTRPCGGRPLCPVLDPNPGVQSLRQRPGVSAAHQPESIRLAIRRELADATWPWQPASGAILLRFLRSQTSPSPLWVRCWPQGRACLSVRQSSLWCVRRSWLERDDLGRARAMGRLFHGPQ